ncbi:hypothetical protein KCU65_g313, partial [Aureobasidium melanogenum]
MEESLNLATIKPENLTVTFGNRTVRQAALHLYFLTLDLEMRIAWCGNQLPKRGKRVYDALAPEAVPACASFYSAGFEVQHRGIDRQI